MNPHDLITNLRLASDDAMNKGNLLPAHSLDRHEWHIIALDLLRAAVRIERLLTQGKLNGE